MTIHISRLRALLQEQNPTPNISALEAEIEQLEQSWDGLKTEIGASRLLTTAIPCSQHYNAGLSKALRSLDRYETGHGIFQKQ